MSYEKPDIYRDLQVHLDQFPIGFPATSTGIELKVLKHLFTESEAQIAIMLTWKYSTKEEIYKNLDQSDMLIDELEKCLDIMVRKGILNFKDENQTKLYANAPLVVGVFEYQVNKLTKEFLEDFSEYLITAFGAELLGTKISQFRTIPIEQSVKPQNVIATYDELRNVIENVEEPIGVANCVCRQGKDLVGKPCNKTSLRETCLYFGKKGKLFISQGWARQINKDEAQALLNKAESDGLVLQAGNTKNPEFICSCCGDCCEILTRLNLLPRPSRVVSANFYASIDPELCSGCGTCITRCQVKAIKEVNGISRVIEKRCIGCGLCVPTCPEEAIILKKKDQEMSPPDSTDELYAMIMEKKQQLRSKKK